MFMLSIREGIGLELDLEEAAEVEVFGKKSVGKGSVDEGFGKKTVGNGSVVEDVGKVSVVEDALKLLLAEQAIPPMLRDEVHHGVGVEDALPYFE